MRDKYMIRCDMEGVSGIVSYEQAEPGKSEYAFGQKMFMSDLLAMVEGLRDGGAEEIVIYDEHYYGRNIDLAILPDYTTAICGKPPYRTDWAGGLDANFNGVILLGFHSKAGTEEGLLPHSYELDIRNLSLNGVSVGEIGMEAAIAGDFNVPVVLVTGDSAGVTEAKALLPGIAVVAVKESISQSGAVCYPQSVTSKKIRSAAKKIANKPTDIKPYTVGREVALEVKLNKGHYLDAIRKIYGSEMTDDNTLILQGKSATDVWSQYWQKKLNAQQQMWTE